MPTLLEQFNEMKIKVAAAMAKNDQAALQQKVHTVYQDEERKRKLTNPQGSTRIVLNMRSPEAFKEFHEQKERFFEIATDPHIALDLLVRALRETPTETIQAWLKEGQEPPEEEEWLK